MGAGAGYAGRGVHADSLSRDGMGSGRVIRDERRCCAGVGVDRRVLSVGEGRRRSPREE